VKRTENRRDEGINPTNSKLEAFVKAKKKRRERGMGGRWEEKPQVFFSGRTSLEKFEDIETEHQY